MTTIPDPNDTTLPSPNDLRKAASAEEPPKKRARKSRAAKAAAAVQSAQALLARCAVNLSELARRGELRRSYGRDETIETIWQLLRPGSSRRPLVLGKARSGKTALAHEIARRIAAGDCPEELRGVTVYETSPASLTASLQFGEGWRENLNTLVQGLGEVSALNGAEGEGALIFLRDAHSTIGAGKQGDDESDLADALVGTLRGGKIRWLAEARADLWRVASGADAAFAECFAPVVLPELSVDATRPIISWRRWTWPARRRSSRSRPRSIRSSTWPGVSCSTTRCPARPSICWRRRCATPGAAGPRRWSHPR